MWVYSRNDRREQAGMVDGSAEKKNPKLHSAFSRQEKPAGERRQVAGKDFSSYGIRGKRPKDRKREGDEQK